MQGLDCSSDIKIRNWVGVSDICMPSSTQSLNGPNISFQSKTVPSSLQKRSILSTPSQLSFHVRCGRVLLCKCVDALPLGFAEWQAFCHALFVPVQGHHASEMGWAPGGWWRHGQALLSMSVAPQGVTSAQNWGGNFHSKL